MLVVDKCLLFSISIPDMLLPLEDSKADARDARVHRVVAINRR